MTQVKRLSKDELSIYISFTCNKYPNIAFNPCFLVAKTIQEFELDNKVKLSFLDTFYVQKVVSSLIDRMIQYKLLVFKWNSELIQTPDIIRIFHN